MIGRWLPKAAKAKIRAGRPWVSRVARAEQKITRAAPKATSASRYLAGRKAKSIPGKSNPLFGGIGGLSSNRAGLGGLQRARRIVPKPITSGTAIPSATGRSNLPVPYRGGVPARRAANLPAIMSPPSPRAVNKKGASGFSHGKKLMYGAMGVGAAGVAYGLTQRQQSMDKTGYNQSRGMFNY